MEEVNVSENSELLQGVFLFTNNDDEDFKVLWNNKEYTFPAKTRSPIIIPEESLENIQSIRKKFAFKWAEKMWFKTKEYERMSKMGNGLPPVRDDKVLEPFIQQCLSPLPISKARVKEMERKDPELRASKVVEEGQDLNYTFRKDTEEGNLRKVGRMPDRPID